MSKSDIRLADPESTYWAYFVLFIIGQLYGSILVWLGYWVLLSLPVFIGAGFIIAARLQFNNGFWKWWVDSI